MSRYLVIEWGADGDDNRPLGVRDEFLCGSFGEDDVAGFPTETAAQAAIQRATNRRPGSTVSLISQARRVAA